MEKRRITIFCSFSNYSQTRLRPKTRKRRNIKAKPNEPKQLNSLNSISKILLYGIADDMPFITPKEYPVKKINKLIKLKN